MRIKCLFGFHLWNGCKCAKCRKIRDVEHDWTEDCEKCAKCGKTRTNIHSWESDCEFCSNCQATRSNSHRWEDFGCVTRCSACRGRMYRNHHTWKNEVCQTCGSNRGQLRDELSDRIELKQRVVDVANYASRASQDV